MTTDVLRHDSSCQLQCMYYASEWECVSGVARLLPRPRSAVDARRRAGVRREREEILEENGRETERTPDGRRSARYRSDRAVCSGVSFLLKGVLVYILIRPIYPNFHRADKSAR